MNSRIVSVERAIEDVRNGKMIILVDDEDRENEGDLYCAAEFATPEMINFMATHARGLICLSLTEEKADSLNLKTMVQKNESAFETAFTDSIDAAEGVTTGISAQDRSHTILTAVSEHSGPEDLAKPGHIFPLRARSGGVLARPGQTEGSVDFSRLAGLKPAGVICEIMNDDGSMARMPELINFGNHFDINIVSIAALIQYRLSLETLVYQTMRKHRLPIDNEVFDMSVYASKITPNVNYVALVTGEINPEEEVPVRIHRGCFIGDFMGSQLCDCNQKLKASREAIAREGRGVLLYIRHKERFIDFELSSKGCGASIEQSEDEQAAAADTSVSRRELFFCGICAKILLDLGVRKIKPITDKEFNKNDFETYGLELTGQIKLKLNNEKSDEIKTEEEVTVWTL